MKASVGKKIIGRLRKFTDALESPTAVSGQFTCSTVVLDLPPRRFRASELALEAEKP